jgi:DNA-binding transcriptional LysR family regulator
MQLTAAGHALETNVRRILAEVETTEPRTLPIARGEVGKLRIGFNGCGANCE